MFASLCARSCKSPVRAGCGGFEKLIAIMYAERPNNARLDKVPLIFHPVWVKMMENDFGIEFRNIIL
jgi:hypothetical protein